ncbi:CLK4-associating serine/arginine rich protein [Trichoplax sp. H2]|nr:CLK4-associating serine/arginine rich protein [Trichoplax sp. H2]|eukprot:RDD44987.1 CLK4-associating serine/arginine rich protein [Trichoplax sp. H2]
MWHEARKHEKKLRGMMVDWKKRAERRRQYYESLASDPFQQLRIVGVAAKIHINVVESSDSMMQWRGQPDILIDSKVNIHVYSIFSCNQIVYIFIIC